MPLVLDDLSLQIRLGQYVAIVGKFKSELQEVRMHALEALYGRMRLKYGYSVAHPPDA